MESALGCNVRTGLMKCRWVKLAWSGSQDRQTLRPSPLEPAGERSAPSHRLQVSFGSAPGVGVSLSPVASFLEWAAPLRTPQTPQPRAVLGHLPINRLRRCSPEWAGESLAVILGKKADSPRLTFLVLFSMIQISGKRSRANILREIPLARHHFTKMINTFWNVTVLIHEFALSCVGYTVFKIIIFSLS